MESNPERRSTRDFARELLRELLDMDLPDLMLEAVQDMRQSGLMGQIDPC
jgi:hypothetical protein